MLMKVKKVKQPITKGVAKVPVTMQLEALECGAAALTMVLSYYGKWIPLEQVRVDCGVSRDGSNAVNIVKAANHYGFKAQGSKCEPEDLKTEGCFPCIIHWEMNHFVVLNGFKNNKAYINDPARGTCTVSMEDFDKSFTGICIDLTPKEDFVPEGKPKSMFGFAKERIKGFEAAMILIILFAAISTLIGIISPVFSRVFIDKLLTGSNPDWVMPFMLFLAGIYILQVIITLINNLTMFKINGKMTVSGSSSFMWKILRLPMRFFSQRMSGDILSRQNSNVAISNVIVTTLAPTVLNTIMMVFYFIVMLRYSWKLALIGVVAIIVNVICARLIINKRVNIARVQARDSGKLQASTMSGIQLIETLKSGGAENGFFEKWAGYQASVNTQVVKTTKLNLYFGLIPQTVSSLCGAAILGLGIFMTMQGEFTLGMITAFQGFYTSFSAPAIALVNAGQTLQELRVQMERVEDVLKYETDVNYKEDASKEDELLKLSGNIEVKDLSFGYAPLGKPLISDFNMTIKPGQCIALVGPSGCGKSTISKLVSGLYHPWEGEILFDGKKITDINRNVFTGSVAVVDQDIVLFEDTISNNIKMWDNSIEDFEMILAAKDAAIHDDIVSRSGGYNFKITEGGKNFSGGQKQRLEIARALAGDPTILVLDEATSALDARTEYEVIQAIKNRGITCILIAHRLSTIRDCDEIIVLDNGHIIERGNHDELMAQGGIYNYLITNE